MAIALNNPFADLVPGGASGTMTASTQPAQSSFVATSNNPFDPINRGGAQTQQYGLPMPVAASAGAEIGLPASAASAFNLSGVNWGAYVQGNPDALANWNAIKNTSAGLRFKGDINAFGRYHYADDGARRDLAPYMPGYTAPAPAGTTPTTTTPTTTTPATPPKTAAEIIRETPGYQFQLDRGLEAINSNAYARGLGQSGATYKALQQFGDGLAQNYYQQYLSNTMAVANQGYGAAGAIAGAGNNMGAGVSGAMDNAAQAYQNSANATANAAYNRANATSQMAIGISQGIGQIAGSVFGSSYGGAR